MSSDLSETITLLLAGTEAEVTTAATRLGLLLERARFERRGTGTLGDVDALLGELAETELSESDVAEVLAGLRRHLNERGLNSNPTVVWAIGNANDGGSSTLVAELADRAIDQPEQSDLLYQALVMLAAAAAGSHRDLFVRAAREAIGEPGEFAAQQVSIHGWS